MCVDIAACWQVKPPQGELCMLCVHPRMTILPSLLLIFLFLRTGMKQNEKEGEKSNEVFALRIGIETGYSHIYR